MSCITCVSLVHTKEALDQGRTVNSVIWKLQTGMLVNCSVAYWLIAKTTGAVGK